jgi:hypothetical protein
MGKQMAGGRDLDRSKAVSRAEGRVEEQHELEDGWLPSTRDDDTMLRQYVLAFADRVEHDAVAMGQQVIRSELAVMADTGIPFALANSVALVRPLRAEEWPELVDAATRLYEPKPFTIWSAWPTPDLRPHGLRLGGHPPFMIRPTGPSSTAGPADLVVQRVTDAAGMQRFVETFARCYPVPELAALESDAWVDERVLHDDSCWFVGSVDGRPVATGAASCTRGVNMVEFISVDAITWAATLAQPELPAVLIASDDGRPVYERMGYATICRFTLWMGPGDDG